MGGIMRVVHSDFFPPFASLAGGRSAGLVVDIVREAAVRVGWRVEFVAVPFERIEAALVEDVADVSIPIAATPERRQRFDFSDTLLLSGGSLFVRSGETTPSSLAALAHRVVVTPRTGPLASYIERAAPDIKLVLTDDYEQSLQLLVSGEADAAALNHQTGAMIASRLFAGRVETPVAMFLELPFVAAALKGRHADAIAALNAGIAAVKAR